MTHEWHGVRGTVHQGVFVTEGDLPGESLGKVSVSIGKQNANLAEIKEKLAAEAHKRGANAVASLRYGQRKHGPLQLVNPLRWDTEVWVGEGEAKRTP
ncbi:MAG TPA: hypothetical protein VFU16_12290 [Solirubrobacterales bacterium]|nr:hypothetical protein [Solirubrobacterales bacterium]